MSQTPSPKAIVESLAADANGRVEKARAFIRRTKDLEIETAAAVKSFHESLSERDFNAALESTSRLSAARAVTAPMDEDYLSESRLRLLHVPENFEALAKALTEKQSAFRQQLSAAEKELRPLLIGEPPVSPEDRRALVAAKNHVETLQGLVTRYGIAATHAARQAKSALPPQSGRRWDDFYALVMYESAID